MCSCRAGTPFLYAQKRGKEAPGEVSICLPGCPKKAVGRSALILGFFDRCAILTSLYPPQAALGDVCFAVLPGYPALSAAVWLPCQSPTAAPSSSRLAPALRALGDDAPRPSLNDTRGRIPHESSG